MNMTGNRIKLIFLILILIVTILGSQASVLAANPEFRLDVDSLNLQKGVSTNLVLSMVNAQGAKLLSIEGLDNFEILNSGQSTSTSIVNGDITQKTDIRYVIMPKTAGQFTLQGTVEYKGTQYRTNKITVNVGESGNIGEGEAEDLFIKTIISDDEIYSGQKLVLSYELYSCYNIEDYGFLDNVEVDGFILSEIPQDKLRANYTYIGDKKYVKYEVKQMYLSPVKTGTFTIPEYNFQVNISTGGFFSSSQPYYLRTESKELTVKPLPQENKPADFSGIVGNLEIESEYSRKEVSYGDSLTLRVTASGNCDLSLLDKIVRDGIPGFSVFETEKDIEENISDNKYFARKEYEIILVPEKSGDIEIDPIYISYFDTESKSYKKAEISGTTVTVTGEAPAVQNQQSKGDAAIEKVKIDQIGYIPKNEGYLTIQLKKEYIYISLAVLAILSLIAVSAFIILRGKKKGDRNLRNMFNKINNSKDEKEIYSILNDIIKHRFNISIKASSKDEIKSVLGQHEITSTVLEIMDYMEADKNRPDKDINYLKDNIKEIYKVLQRA